MKQAHWNVKGPSFIGLHELFDKVDEAVESYVDMIAKRIVQLGGIAEGTARVAASCSQLEEYPLAIADGAPCKGDLETAEIYGRRVAEITLQFVSGRNA